MKQVTKQALSTETIAEIGLRLETLEDDWGRELEGAFATARRNRALPLMLDVGGFYALDVEGAVVSFEWDALGSDPQMASDRERDIALVAGALRYPFLRPLLPVRSSRDGECAACKGTGIEPISAAAGLENVRCYCGGLGWIPNYWRGQAV